MSDAISVSIPVLIKSRSENGKRLVSVESSVETCDLEGDVILQSALLAAAKAFVKSGHIDVDHLSEIGHRIPNLPMPPSYYRIGRPVEVKDLGNGRTGTLCELFQHDGVNPATMKAEEVWNSLQTSPPMPWRASIYGFPTNDGLVDVRVAKSGTDTHGATRYLVSGIQWQSLALTCNPINDAIASTAHIVSSKAIIKALTGQFAQKSFADPIPAASPTSEFLANYMLSPRSREEMLGAHYREHIAKGRCPHAGGGKGNSVFTFREHYANCCCEDPHTADMHALATMYLLKRESDKRGASVLKCTAL